MTTCPVQRCGRPANPGWTICKPDAEGLRLALADLPALGAQLDTTLSRQGSRLGYSSSRSAEHPLPYDPRASEAHWVLINTLIGWCREISTAHEYRGQPGGVGDMGRYLLARYGQIIVNEYAGEAVEEIGAAVANGWKTVDVPVERLFLGRCPECLLADVYAPATALAVACPECGHIHVVQALRDALTAALDDQLVTAAEYAAVLPLLGIPIDRDRARALVNTWATRGRITTHAGPTYRFGELQSRMVERMERAQ